MLDFQKRKKKYFDLTLHDGTKLQLPTPTLEIFESLTDIAQDPKNVEREQLEALLQTLLRTNKNKIEINNKQVQAFDLSDILDLFTEYLKFVTEVLSDPNSKSLIVR